MGIGGLTLTSGMSLGTHNGMVVPNGQPSSLTLQVLSDTSLGGTQTSTSTNQDGYYAYISTDNITFTRVLSANITWTGANFTIINLIQGTAYYVYTTAYKGSKESAPSNTVTANTTLLAPSAATSEFIVDTILGKVDFTDNSGGTAQHEVYSNTNAAGDVLLTTLNAGIVTYNDTTCKQNASVVYKVRAKKGSIYSTYATITTLSTPLCWKTNQATRTDVVINTLNITAGKTVNVDWGDGTNANYIGNNTNITKTYDASAINVFNIKLSGDTNSITTFQHFNQIKSYGVVTNWVLPSTLTGFYIHLTGLTGVVTNWVLPSTLKTFYIHSTGLTGVVTNWVLPSTLTYFYIHSTGLTGVVTNWVLPSTLLHFAIHSTGLTGVVTNWVLPSTLAYFAVYYTGLTGAVTNWVLPSTLTTFSVYSTGLTGSLPQITTHATNTLVYQALSSSISDSVVTVFRKAMTIFNISNQNVAFSTANIDKVLKALADWYQVNAPTANCTFTMNGVNMGIPTGGANNADLLRLAQYYANASKTATIIISS